MDPLKKQRGTVKGKITRVKTFLESAIASGTVDIRLAKQKLKVLVESWIEYNAIHHQLTGLAANDQELTDLEADLIAVECIIDTVEPQLTALTEGNGSNDNTIPTQLERMERRCAAAEQKIDRAKGELNTAITSGNLTIHGIKARQEELTNAWLEYNQLYDELIEYAPTDRVSVLSATYVTLEQEVFTAKVKIREIIDELTPVDPNPFRHRSGSSSSGSVKLPRMDLPKFSGDQLEWSSFHDLFSSIVDKNTEISDAQKLHFLKSCLKDEAAGLIQSIDITDANYAVAWKLIVERYENKRQLIHCHLSQLFAQSALTQESASNLRNLLDTTVKHKRALHSLGLATDEWDAILVFVVSVRLDPESRKQWELSSNSQEFPSFKEMQEFLDHQCRALQATKSVIPKEKQGSSTTKTNQLKSHAAYTENSRPDDSKATQVSYPCPICKSNHFLYQCDKFKALSLSEKQDAAKKAGACFNCLRYSHSSKKCQSKSRCRVCNGKHHTLIHDSSRVKPAALAVELSPNPSPVVSTHLTQPYEHSQVLLCTARVKVEDAFGNTQICRALLDSGSQASFITEATVHRLGLKRTKSQTSIKGIGGSTSGQSLGKVSLVIHATESSFSLSLDALVLKKLTGELPCTSINIKHWSHIEQVKLADPQFHIPGEIDILLGNDVLDEIQCDKRISWDGFPTLRLTHFGWTLSGKVRSSNQQQIVSHVSTFDDVTDLLQKFWEMEDMGNQHTLTSEEKACETHFNATHYRDPSGRYVVSIPFKEKIPESNSEKCLGHSKEICIKRLQQVERRFQKFPEFKAKYQSFMDQYLELGHMEIIPQESKEEIPEETNYLPHHFVLKDSSMTTSLRVVFDASAKTSSGVSLNEKMLIGPTIQDDLWSILMRFRLRKYAFTADIAKMYRQIKINPKDADFQRILWRRESNMPIQEFRLTTVTYGTASAPYLATKALQQLAFDEGHKFPLAKEITLRDFYVDDVMSGHNSLTTALQIQTQLMTMLKLGGFELRKWSANHTELLQNIPQEYRETNLPLKLDSDDSIKALGLHWNPSQDFFFFIVSLPEELPLVSKRNILSETSRLFDPLGWLSPCIIIAKILLQKLWLSGINWDDEVHDQLKKQWLQFRQQLIKLQEIHIPRPVSINAISYQLHGFCDASEQAFAAVMYLRTVSTNGSITCRLICSKTKVAPLKKISIPRLELSGAVILARLITKTATSLKLNQFSIHAWSDSTVTLDWISGSSHRWKTFVANRVNEIQELVPPTRWKHVPTSSNPADLASRGVFPVDLICQDLWWNGPSWLINEESEWPQIHRCPTINDPVVLQEQRSIPVLTSEVEAQWDLLVRFSSLIKLKRITAYCQRFIKNLKESRNTTPCLVNGPLTTMELEKAMSFWIKYVQIREFRDALQQIQDKKCPNRLITLNPFIDPTGILRVGGRLRNSDLSYDHKFPILLPKKSPLTKLIIASEHIRLLHAGPQMLIASIRQKYWILHGNSVVRQFTRKCVRCVRDRAATMEQKMGDLPHYRLQPSRPFLKSGVDFGGPFLIKSNKGRGGKISKSYISLFKCLSTKAIHLELVTDLTAEAFIAAMRRFMARRGKSSDIHCDNGTNFVGASKELKDMEALLKSSQFLTSITKFTSNEGIKWHFSPPRAPHFGGIWEADIRSVKKHIHRVLGNASFTYEEFYTCLTQIEACLNSRPLCPTSSDPNDLAALTPGHFLIGEPLTSIPDPDLSHLKVNRLSRWQLCQQVSQHFWKRWHLEYLSQLQQRPKWQKSKPSLSVGDLVLLKDDNSPPLKWILGRVLQLHPGKDNLVRVVTVKTSAGILKRPIVKLCHLPCDQ